MRHRNGLLLAALALVMGLSFMAPALASDLTEGAGPDADTRQILDPRINGVWEGGLHWLDDLGPTDDGGDHDDPERRRGRRRLLGLSLRHQLWMIDLETGHAAHLSVLSELLGDYRSMRIETGRRQWFAAYGWNPDSATVGMFRVRLTPHRIGQLSPVVDAGDPIDAMAFDGHRSMYLAVPRTERVNGQTRYLDSELHRWDLESGERSFVATLNSPYYRTLAMNPDGQLVSLQDWEYRRIDPITGAVTVVTRWTSGGHGVDALGFGPRGKLYGVDDSLWRVDPATGEKTLVGLLSRYGPDLPVDPRIQSLAFAPVRAVETTVRIGNWSTCPPAIPLELEEPVRFVITGTDRVNVHRLDPRSVRYWEGEAPLRTEIRDVVRPPSQKLGCPEEVPDGIDDLVAYFDRATLLDKFRSPSGRNIRQLTASAFTRRGTVVYAVGLLRLVDPSIEGLPGDESTARQPTLSATPNPFNPRTTVRFELESSAAVSLVVYDLRGRRVRTMVDSTLERGPHDIRWNGTDDQGRPVSSGNYRAVLRVNGRSSTIGLVLIQ